MQIGIVPGFLYAVTFPPHDKLEFALVELLPDSALEFDPSMKR